MTNDIGRVFLFRLRFSNHLEDVRLAIVKLLRHLTARVFTPVCGDLALFCALDRVSYDAEVKVGLASALVGWAAGVGYSRCVTTTGAQNPLLVSWLHPSRKKLYLLSQDRVRVQHALGERTEGTVEPLSVFFWHHHSW